MGFHEHWLIWPKSLDPGQWDKNKGVFAKVIKGETGIGAKLKEAKSAFDRVQAHLYTDMSVDVSTKAACDAAEKQARTEFGAGVKACTDKLLELKNLAHAQAAKFKHPLIPKSSREYVEAIEDEAQAFSDKLRAFCVKSIADIRSAKDHAPT